MLNIHVFYSNISRYTATGTTHCWLDHSHLDGHELWRLRHTALNEAAMLRQGQVRRMVSRMRKVHFKWLVLSHAVVRIHAVRKQAINIVGLKACQVTDNPGKTP